MRYVVLIEKASRGFSAWSPDLPGCVATGRTRAEARRRMAGAVKLHLKGLADDRVRPPKPTTTAAYVAVD